MATAKKTTKKTAKKATKKKTVPDFKGLNLLSKIGEAAASLPEDQTIFKSENKAPSPANKQKVEIIDTPPVDKTPTPEPVEEVAVKPKAKKAAKTITQPIQFKEDDIKKITSLRIRLMEEDLSSNISVSAICKIALRLLDDNDMDAIKEAYMQLKSEDMRGKCRTR